MSLLEKTRAINSVIQNSAGNTLNFKELADVLSECSNSNVYVVSRKGKVLGFSEKSPIENERMKQMLAERKFPEEYTQGLFNVNQTAANLNVTSEYSAFPVENSEFFKNGLTTIIPVVGGGNRLATLVLSRLGEEFTEEDLVLCEFSSTMVAMAIIHEKIGKIEEEARDSAIVSLAIRALSFSELRAVIFIFEELKTRDGMGDGVVVASSIADDQGITRSVIVNALRKLESAGIIQSCSLGMKGTRIKVLNKKFLPELEKAKHN